MFRVCFVILSPSQRMKLVAFFAFDSREFGKIAHAVVCVLLVQHCAASFSQNGYGWAALPLGALAVREPVSTVSQ